MKDKHPIDEYFKARLDAHELKPSPAVWEKIEAATESSTQKGMLWYMMRAAVVVLMFSLGTWFIGDRPLRETGVSNTAIAVETVNPEKEKTEAKTGKKQNAESPQIKAQKKEEKVVPVMKNSRMKSRIFVGNELPVEDEELLYAEKTYRFSHIELDPRELAQYERVEPKLKLRINKPVTERAFYAEAGEAGDAGEVAEEPDLKKKIYAYANHQFDNLMNGRPMELPKAGRPQLQINIDKILNN